IRRSGRFKCKRPVIEENSINEAIDVDEYLSDEEGSEYSGELHGDNTAGGASTLEGIPSKLGFYVVDNFDETTMEIKMENASLLITMESIADMIGIINEERCCFERTFDAAKEIFSRNTMSDELKKRFIESLKYQQEENAETGRASRGLDSPRYQLGLQTQAIVCETTNKLYKECEQKYKEVANTYGKDVEAFSSRKSESRLSIDMEENRVKARRDPLDSPFYVRVVNVDKVENNKEKQLANFLFNKRDGDDSDVLFKTKYGHQSLRGQIETLGSQEPVDDNVLSSWSAYLNFMEEKKDSISPARLFFPTFEVDKKLFAGDNAYTLDMFMKYAENANSSYRGQTMLEKADILAMISKNFLCVNLNNPAVTLIDSKKEGNKFTCKKKKDDGVDDMRVASILHRIFDQYLYDINHVKAAQIIESQIVHAKLENGNAVWMLKVKSRTHSWVV
nr:hypothetical protein [Tanacetum cinerariifolium]GEY44872.1 hypothetical protein [Tanacetum cinerariifolium]